LRRGRRPHQLIQRSFHRRIKQNNGSDSCHAPTIFQDQHNVKNYLDDVLVSCTQILN
jgi:hypothetical protein